MRELKAFNSERIYWAVEQVERAAGDIDRLHLDDNWFYLKSEADKAIAELKESVKNLIIDNYLKDKELRRHKYKRCVAMADKCVDLCHKAKDLYRCAEDENLEHHYNHKIEFFARWHNRWLAIAEKFKPNSTAQQGKGKQNEKVEPNTRIVSAVRG